MGQQESHLGSGNRIGEQPLLQSFDCCLKLIVIGPSSSGKTSLLHNLKTSQFLIDQDQTIGVEFSSKLIQLGERRVKLQLWDTAGQERYRSVTQSYYTAAAGIALVFDICDKDSFLSLDAWIEDIRQLAPPDVVILICGNKKDKEESRVVFYEEGSKYAQEIGALYTETSAKDHESVLEAFTLLTNEVLPKAEEAFLARQDDNSVIDVVDLQTLTSRGCPC